MKIERGVERKRVRQRGDWGRVRVFESVGRRERGQH